MCEELSNARDHSKNQNKKISLELILEFLLYCRKSLSRTWETKTSLRQHSVHFHLIAHFSNGKLFPVTVTGESKTFSLKANTSPNSMLNYLKYCNCTTLLETIWNEYDSLSALLFREELLSLVCIHSDFQK